MSLIWTLIIIPLFTIAAIDVYLKKYFDLEEVVWIIVFSCLIIFSIQVLNIDNTKDYTDSIIYKSLIVDSSLPDFLFAAILIIVFCILIVFMKKNMHG